METFNSKLSNTVRKEMLASWIPEDLIEEVYEDYIEVLRLGHEDTLELLQA